MTTYKTYTVFTHFIYILVKIWLQRCIYDRRYQMMMGKRLKSSRMTEESDLFELRKTELGPTTR